MPAFELRWLKFDLETCERFSNFKIAKAGNRYFVIGGRSDKSNKTSPCSELIERRIVKRENMTEQREWFSVTQMIKSDGQRQLYAIGGKNYSSVELRSIERYDLDMDKWIGIKTILNQKGMFTTAITFENRYVYVMDTMCQTIEVLDTEKEDKMCTLLYLKLPDDLQFMRPLLLPLNENEILYLRNSQDSFSLSEYSGSSQMSQS